MKQSHEEFIRLLANAMNVDEDKASRELADWVSTVIKNVDEKGTYHISGLGEFYRAEGKLMFKPDEKPALEVNYKYAGMQPLEITPSQSRKKEEDEEQKDEADREKKPEAPLDNEEDVFIQSEDESDAGDLKESEPEKTTEHEPAAAEEPGDEKQSVPGDTDVFETETADEQEPEEKEPVAVAADESTKQKTEPRSKKKAAGNGPKENESRVWMLPIAAAVVVGILLFFHFHGQILEQQLIADRPAADEPAVVAQEESGPMDEEVTGEEPGRPPEHEIGPVPEEEELPYGLMGPEEEVLIGSYTIVVHSIVSENRARIEKEELMEEGYKATLWQARLPDGSLTWRVGIGQFQSVSDAERAIEELPEPYRSNNFIIRIR